MLYMLYAVKIGKGARLVERGQQAGIEGHSGSVKECG